MAGNYDTTIKVGLDADLSGGVQTEKQLEAIRKKAKQMGDDGAAGAGKAGNAMARLQSSVGLLRKALTGFGVAGLFAGLISQIGKIAASFKSTQKSAEEFRKVQLQLAQEKGVQQLAADYDRLKDSVAAAAKEQQHSAEMADLEIANRRRLEKAQRDAAKEAELSGLDPSDPAYAQKKAAIEARYARKESEAASAAAYEDVAMQQSRLGEQADAKLKEAEAQDAQTALVRRKLGNAQIELSRAQNESVSLNESDKTGTLSAVGKTMGQLFTGDWGRMAEAKTEEGDAIRRDAAKRAAAAELKVGELQEQLRKSEAQAAELRREAARLREKQGKVGGALDAIRVEDQTSLGANLRAQSAADRAVGKRLAEVEKDESTIAQGPGRIAALKKKIAAVEAQKSSAISADAKEQMDAEMARQALASFDAAGYRRNGTGVQARRGELEADVARETQEANRSRAQLQSTLATLSATLKGLNADLKKVEREVEAATKRQNAVNEEAPAA